MRFGKTLREAIYPPWREHYIDYAKLKAVLREDKHDDETTEWTEDDEQRFCDEIMDVQLGKVAQFQQDRADELKTIADKVFEKLKDLSPTDEQQPRGDIAIGRLRELEAELDEITNEIRRLKKFGSINYTGFLKIVKKHDRKRGGRYRVRPIMQLSLAQRPFNSDQAYSALLNKLSIMYYAVRQQLEGDTQVQLPGEVPAETHNGERYTAHKYWVHPDNLLEVKTLILRRLPALVYSQQSAKELDGNDSPAITSVYLDNNKFDIYTGKVDRQPDTSSVRLRWFGQLSESPEIFLEKKTAEAGGKSEESKFTIKAKYVKPFLDGEYTMEKTVQKLERQNKTAEQIDNFKSTVGGIQGYLRRKELSPLLRASYLRTAFQKPADDRVRISIDTDLAFIREDTLDTRRPCRDPSGWHRADIDDSNMTYPFKNINQSEVSKFPYAVLEIKLKEENRKRSGWIEELMASHLVHPVPQFSKFVHGVASLFEDYVNNLPFWLSDLETDIRKDPQKAFDEEEQRRAQRADDANAVGSLMGTAPSASYQAARSSPMGKSYLAERAAADASELHSSTHSQDRAAQKTTQDTATEEAEPQPTGYGSISSVLPGFSLTRYSKARHARNAPLPEGVVEPTEWIKNAGELKIEPKVWLANERTFLKWQHICVLLGTLAVGLYTAAGENRVAEAMGIIYIVVAAFSGAWGYYLLQTRRTMILERSGKDFDNMIGPIVLSVAMMGALVVNFVFAYRKAFASLEEGKSVESEVPIMGDLV